MTPENPPGAFVDRQQVRRSFARVAPRYGDADFLVREIDRRMQERLEYVRIEPQRILDLGCSRGASLTALAARYPQAALLGLDLSPEMLAAGAAPRPSWQRWLGLGKSSVQHVAADAAHLPLAPRSVGMVWSNLLLHWLDHPLPALAEAHRVLEVGGLLMFSTFGPDTLKELRQAFADGHAHTQRFTDMHDLGDMLVESGYADPVMDMEVVTLTYEDLDALFGDLKQAGSSCAMTMRRHGLTGRGTIATARAKYEAMRREGRLPATFEVIYGHAWKVVPTKLADGRSVVNFAPRPGR